MAIGLASPELRESLAGLFTCLFTCLLAAGAQGAVDPAVRSAEAARVALIEQMAPTVVAIFDAAGQGGGSGVLISRDGFVVTNFHVVQGQGPLLKCGLNDGRLYDGVLAGIDPTGDLAVVQLLGRDDFPAATIGDSDQVAVGDGAFALGNPFLLAADFQPTVTYGMVSGVHRYQFPAGTFLEYTDCIQVDTSINPGNSGGPLFNERGELIGINGRISAEKRGRVNVGAGYAISINQVTNFLDHLKSGRIVDHATFGASVITQTDGPVIVSRILEQSEAYRRGLLNGDEITAFAGRRITTANQFKNLLGIYPAGWKLPVTYRRDDQEHQIVVRLRPLHRAAELSLDGPPRPEPDGGPEGPDRRRPDGPPDDPDRGDEPEDRDDAERPGPPRRGGPRRGAPGPGPGGEPAAPAVEFSPEAQARVEQRTGFVNYWYNRQAQAPLLAALGGWGDYSTATGAWRIEGRLGANRAAEFRLTKDVIALRLGDQTTILKADEDPGDHPPGTGGLLPAMDALRRLLIDPQTAYSDLYYLGSEPLDGTGPRVDVMIGERGASTTRLYFDKSTAQFVGLDFAFEQDQDECELRILESAEFGGRKFPKRLRAATGGADLGELLIQQVSTAE